MPRVAIKNADRIRKQHPREFSLLVELGGTAEGIDSQASPCIASRPSMLPAVENAC